ncbi:MAG: universal stress protein [Planctomycetia bacterium]|nr:universal stress protein [Planctomycetia bacterium]
MYRTILVPLDGSAFSEQALPLAGGLARAAGAVLHLVQVHNPVVTPDFAEGLVTSASFPSLDEAARANERAYLDRVVQRLRGVVEVPVSCALLDDPIAASLDAEAQARQAGLIVMTTHGRGAFNRFWLGSVADQLLRRSTTPILLMRPQETAPELRHPPKLQRLLVPLDGSPLAEGILAPAQTLGKLSDAEYTLLQVLDPLLPAGRDAEGFVVSGLAPAAMKELKTQAEGYLTGVAGRMQARPEAVQRRVVVGTQIAETILEQAGALSVDAIAIATHGRGGWRRLLLGSVADKVVRGAHVPVLVYRPAAPPEAGGAS